MPSCRGSCRWRGSAGFFTPAGVYGRLTSSMTRPLVLSSAALLDGSLDSDHLWKAMSAARQSAEGGEFGEDELEVLMSELEGQNAAANVFMRDEIGGMGALPLLAVTSVEGLGTSTVEVVVEQVQARYGLPVRDGVPFALGCQSQDAEALSNACVSLLGGGGVPIYFEANETLAGASVASAMRISLPAMTDVLHVDDGVNLRSSLAVEVAVLGPEYLVPDHVGLVIPDWSSAAFEPYTRNLKVWQLHCDPTATDTTCSDDLDGDGVPNDWDVDLFDPYQPGPDLFWLFDSPAVAAGAPEDSTRCVDYNSDGYPITILDPSCG